MIGGVDKNVVGIREGGCKGGGDCTVGRGDVGFEIRTGILDGCCLGECLGGTV